jgi:hypothetical protein
MIFERIAQTFALRFLVINNQDSGIHLFMAKRLDAGARKIT